MNSIGVWKKCSSCKKDIMLKSRYYECSVSTCTGLRTGYVFCSVTCWEVHLPGARHRDAGAVEKTAPAIAGQEAPVRRIIVGTPSNTSPAQKTSSAMSHEVLVVVSKMKQYIRDISDMNTSEDVNQLLSDIIRTECEKAITSARSEGRKTVMARDFKPSK